MTGRDPTRLFDESSGMLRDALEVAREALPTDEQLASLAAKLGPLLGGPGPGPGGGEGGGGGGAAAGGGSAAAAAGATGKLLLAAAVVLAGTTLTWLATRPPSPPADGSLGTGPNDPDDAGLAAGPVPDATAGLASGPVPDATAGAEDAGIAVERHARVAPGRVPDATREVVPPEAELVGAAQRALEADAREALRLAGAHARHYADGMLAQEREVIAIDALVRLGRRAEAERRAERFSQRWPRSAHLRRITVLLEGD